MEFILKINAIALIISTVVGILATRIMFTFYENMLETEATFDIGMCLILLTGALIQYLLYYYLKNVIR